jgi:CHAD domain-containing protein
MLRPARKVMPSLVRARWGAVQRQVRRAGSHPTPAQLHRIRIKAKQLRYAAEAATPVSGKPARRMASAAKRVQTVLGQHHDAVGAEAWLQSKWGGRAGETPASSASTLAFDAGVLAADARRRQHEARLQWYRASATLRNPKLRRRLSKT